MNKKWAILLTLVVMAVIYLFLLVGIPMLASMIGACGSADTVNSSDIDVPVNWPIGPILDVRTYWETYKPPWIFYSIPGLVGIAIIVKKLKETKIKK